MTMTRDQVIAFADELAKSLQNDDTLDTFTNDVFDDLGRRASPPFIAAVIKALTSGTAVYAFESDMLRAVHTIMYDELLSPCSEPALDAYSSVWQADSGTPIAITQDVITARQYRLYPTPDFTSDPLIPIHGQPYGEDFPDNSLVLLYADDRESDILEVFAIPIAFDALAREFSYPSDHTDVGFATTCRALSQLFYSLLGVL